MSIKKINHQKLEKELIIKKKSCWETWDEKTKSKAFAFAENYKKFLNSAKTENEAVKTGEVIARKNGLKILLTLRALRLAIKFILYNETKA